MLRVTSATRSFASFLATSTLPVYKTYERREPRLGRTHSPHTHFGFDCDVSSAAFDDLPAQIRDADRFLTAFEDELRQLVASHPIDTIRLDFAHSCRLSQQTAAQFDYLPPALLLKAGALNIGIELSLYPIAETE